MKNLVVGIIIASVCLPVLAMDNTPRRSYVQPAPYPSAAPISNGPYVDTERAKNLNVCMQIAPQYQTALAQFSGYHKCFNFTQNYNECMTVTYAVVEVVKKNNINITSEYSSATMYRYGEEKRHAAVHDYLLSYCADKYRFYE
jgi:hypothetical protein